MWFHRVVLLLIPAAAVFPALAQSVVSVRSGVVHFFEGSVSIDGQPLEPKFGRFYEIKPGSELRSDAGRAEILLTPGVLLRVDQNSSIRMLSDRLTDTRVEFIGGSAALDSSKAQSDAPITIAYKDYRVRLKKPGRYRFDSAPAELRISTGEAEVTLNGKSLAVEEDQVMPFNGMLAAKSSQAEIDKDDGLDRWSKDRSESIASDNAAAIASDDLTDALNDPQDSPYDFTAAPYYVGGDPAMGSSAYGYGTYLAPLSIFGGPIINVLPYRYGISGYRPGYPIHRAPYTPPTQWRPAPRIMTAPAYRAAPATGIAHPIGHR